MRCAECQCVSDDAPGWVALLARAEDDAEQPDMVAFCPPCASREFRIARSAAADYV